MISRLRGVLAVILTLLVVFTGRLMYLQFAMAEEFSLLSDQNVWETHHISPLRGRILARDGTVLADNRIASDLMYWGGEIEQWPRLKFLLNLSDYPEAPDPSDPEEYEEGKVVAWNIPDELVPAIEELVAGSANLYVRQRIERTYPTNLAAHVVGYTTVADPQRFPGYELGDLVGQMGIESSYQDTLFGEPGVQLIKRDNRRVILDSRTIKPAVPGEDLVLTIDPTVQSAAEESLKGALEYVNEQRKADNLPAETTTKGALIAMNPKTGEILAMASYPTFDQNIFTKRPSPREEISELLTDNENLPLTNRAVQAYPPASTYKLVTSSTLLEDGYISPTTKYYCSAFIRFGGIRWDNWSYPGSRGNYDVTDAIGDSCNTFYWQAILNTPNVTKGWAEFAQKFTARARELGYGQPVGVGLEEEKAGRVPDNEWTKEYHGWSWRPGDTLNVSIGQGDTLATPIQTLQALGTYVMNGKQIKPHLLKRVGDEEVLPEVKEIPGQFWSTLQEGMRNMVTDYGTNYTLGPASGFPIKIAGKSGTAQNSRGDGYDHTWFMAYGPIDDPELAVVTFIEYANKSTIVAVPTVRDFMAKYWGVELE